MHPPSGVYPAPKQDLKRATIERLLKNPQRNILGVPIVQKPESPNLSLTPAPWILEIDIRGSESMCVKESKIEAGPDL